MADVAKAGAAPGTTACASVLPTAATVTGPAPKPVAFDHPANFEDHVAPAVPAVSSGATVRLGAPARRAGYEGEAPAGLTPSLLFSGAEVEQLTGYRRPSKQLAELHRQGFLRARRNRLGDVVLERGHYDAVVAGRQAPAEQHARPQVRLLKRRA